MQKYTSDDRPPVWVASDPLPESKLQSAQRKVFEFQRKHELDAPQGVPAEPIEERATFYAHGLKCPSVAYPVEGYEIDSWAGLLFYEVEDGKPRPDTDLLLGFPDEKGTAFVVTRRGTNRIRADIIAN